MGIFDLFSSKPAEEAAAAKEAAARAGYAQYGDLAGQGRNALTTNYTAALQPYQQLYDTARGGTNAYADATGASGPEGLARARANFQSSPGFDFQLDTGIDALARAGVARGQATGNTLQDAQKFGSGLASQEWGNYINRLQPFLGAGQNAASGIGNTYTGLGQGLAGSYGQQGQAAIGTQNAIGQAQSDAALAPYNASANLWNFGLNAAKTAASFIPGAPKLPTT